MGYNTVCTQQAGSAEIYDGFPGFGLVRFSSVISFRPLAGNAIRSTQQNEHPQSHPAS
jgi:hypothetical protein